MATSGHFDWPLGEPMDLTPILWIGSFIFGIATVISALMLEAASGADDFAWWMGIIWAFLAGAIGWMGAMSRPGSWVIETDHWILWTSLIIGGGMLATLFITRMLQD